MRNILAIAQKELKSYFASPIAYIVIGFFALLYGYFYAVDAAVLRARQHAAWARWRGQQAMNINQDMLRPVLQNVTRAAAVRAAGDHDADLLRGEALGHDRAAAHLAAHRLPDHHGQVPRRAGAVRRDAGGHARSTSASCSSTAARSGSRSLTSYLGLLLLGGSFLSLGLFISSLTKNQIVAYIVDVLGRSCCSG